MNEHKLRVAFIDNVLEPDKPGRSGLSDTIWDMASVLIDQGHEAHVIAAYSTTHYPDHRVIVHNFPAPPLGYRNIIGQLWIVARAAGIVKQLQPDIVHTRDYISTAVLATLGARIPLVLTVPGNVFQRIREGHSYEWHFVQVLKWAARTSARRCAAIIATSREMQHWWEWTGSPPERTLWIPLGVSATRFCPIPNARERLRIPRDKQFWLYVGRFSREKGLLDLLDALAPMRCLLDPAQVQVTLIGKGPQEEDIRSQIERSGLSQIVQMRPWVAQDELSTWYSAADALLLPSWNEPFGKVMIEAMACATPVIASATEGPKDHIRNGSNGFLFAPRDTHALAEILGKSLQNSEFLRRMRSSSLVYAQQHLTWSRIMARVTNEVYFPIINPVNILPAVPQPYG